MNGDRFRELRRVFESALDVAPAARAQHVLEQTGGDRALTDEVLALLREDGDEPAASAMLDAAPGAALAIADLPAHGIAGFRIVRRIGAGGMGTVYEAWQERPQRRVALKTLSVALRGERARQRFEDEADILARLQHPGIAQVLAVGTLGDGDGEAQVPWFAMELVDEPRPLDRFARERDLDPRAIAALLALVCDAVHHAHQRGVLHRDLKPANVLVDATGQPKVIDFGIARLSDGDRRVHTRTGELLGTLTYMSPERLEHGAAGEDSGADVWALGVMLYELLAGRAPFPLDELPPARAVDLLRTHEPPPPSRVRKGVPRELDWIAARAMERSPRDRYASAAELAADLRRWQGGEPVQAGPWSATRRLQQLARRHKVALGVAGVVVCALATGLAFAFAGWRDAAIAGERARQEAATLAEVNRFQQRILRGAWGHASGRDVRLADVVDAAAADLDRQQLSTPRVETGVRNAIGASYLGLGMLPEAERQFERARTLVGEAAIAADDETVLALGNNLGLCREARGDLQGAEAELQRVLAGQLARFGEEHTETATTRLNLANVQLKQARAGDALANAERARATFARLLGDRAESTILAGARVAAALAALGRLDDADVAFDAALAAAEEHLGPEHPGTLDVANSRATHLRARGRVEEYVAAEQRLAEVCERLLGPAHPRTLAFRNNVAVGQLDRGDLAGAERTLRAIQAARAAAGLTDGFDVVLTGQNLTATIRRQGRAADAEVQARKNREVALATVPADNWLVGVVTKEHGACLRELGRFAEAEPLLLAAFASLERAVGPADQRTQKVVGELVQLYEQMERQQDAEAWRGRQVAPPTGR